jgi:copper chaperone NosL
MTMRIPVRAQSLLLCVLALLGLLIGAGCEQRTDTDRIQQPPVAFRVGDECQVCGMIITRFPGPRGEAWVSRRAQPLKFCSTRDLFAWLLQPETAAVVENIYVHDMAQSDWSQPDDAHLIEARKAWYVAGSTRTGAMGPTLAPFAARDAAQAFADEYGGRLLGFDEITLPVLESMMPAAGEPLH